MGELLTLPELAVPINRQRQYYNGCPTPNKTHPLLLLRAAAKTHSFADKTVRSPKLPCVQSSFQGGLHIVDRVTSSPDYKAACCDEEESEAIPYIQTLRKFPKEKLMSKVVMVRFDSTVLLREELGPCSQSCCNAVYTIRYLCEAGARVVIVSDWSNRTHSKLVDVPSIANVLSSVLQLKVVAVPSMSSAGPLKIEALERADVFLLKNLSEFKEEVANCRKFAELLSSGVDIFVNDSFSSSHKVLASTIGIARSCYASMAGFHFEKDLCKLKEVAKADKKPYVAIVGGGNLHNKAAALYFLASRCDGLVFVGMMLFQILHALGHYVPSNLIERGACKAALHIIQIARDRNIPILYPKDFWCMNDHHSTQVEVIPAHSMRDSWQPFDIGPRSLEEVRSLLKQSQGIIWIGPTRFMFSSQCTNGASKLVEMLDELSQRHCNVTVVGKMACNAVIKDSMSMMSYHMIANAAVVWEFFKHRKLPGVLALDRAYPFEINWSIAYQDPVQQLVVDIGSDERNTDPENLQFCSFSYTQRNMAGNGLFLLGMAKRRKDLNFLGLEINRKLVRRCLDSAHQSGIWNGYFIATNATSTFHSIVSSYTGELVLISIQCPNPDFNNPEYRWRMLQRSLVEAVADLLAHGGQVFLQSDVEEVVLRIQQLFLKYGKGKLTQGVWVEENPFGVRSDWEQHVIDRGDPMYRLLLSKSSRLNDFRMAGV